MAYVANGDGTLIRITEEFAFGGPAPVGMAGGCYAAQNYVARGIDRKVTSINLSRR
ncbi:hypothetical protein [Spirosoma aerophilum]